MAYEEDFWQEIVRILIFLSILSCVEKTEDEKKATGAWREVPMKDCKWDDKYPCEMYAEDNRL